MGPFGLVMRRGVWIQPCIVVDLELVPVTRLRSWME